MSKRYRLTVRAEEDVGDIWLYIAADNIDAADKLIDRFTHLYEQLATNPDMGPAQEQYRKDLRCFPVGKYIIFYRPIDDGIEVFRVLHGARHLDDLL
jgi:toxin ParE1/3/4